MCVCVCVHEREYLDLQFGKQKFLCIFETFNSNLIKISNKSEILLLPLQKPIKSQIYPQFQLLCSLDVTANMEVSLSYFIFTCSSAIVSTQASWNYPLGFPDMPTQISSPEASLTFVADAHVILVCDHYVLQYDFCLC